MALAFLRTIYVYKIIAYHTAIFITAAASGYACKSEIHIKCKGKGGKIKSVLIFLKFPNNNAIFVSRYNITEDIALMVPPVSINIFGNCLILHIKVQNIH